LECNRGIAVDAMSGDNGPSVVVPAVLRAIKEYPEVELILVGDRQQLRKLLMDPLPQRLSVVHAGSVVQMHDKPSHVLRRGQNSSMSVALGLVKEDRAKACVSAGNTGALMVLGRSILRTHPGIERPAIVKLIPSLDHRCYILDLGANVDCRAEHLVQFAIMGSVLVNALDGIKEPRVALLNVGEEEIKGNEQVRLASRMLSEAGQVNYTGYVEGGALYRATSDVIVCDGFVGNIALKASEGVADMIAGKIKQCFSASLYGRFVSLLAMPMLNKISTLLDPPLHNGASLIGLQGTVVKSHGDADARGFFSAIEQAIFETDNQVPEKISRRLDELL